MDNYLAMTKILCEALGVDCKITFDYELINPDDDGAFRYEKSGKIYRISINSSMDEFQTLFILAHEIYHAYKFKNYLYLNTKRPDLFTQAYKSENAKNGYENNIYEVEVNDFATHIIKSYSERKNNILTKI
jgi:Zn-dependent peptidase ImmA (M78 family)